MAARMFLSVLYNLIIFISLYAVYWGFTNKHYEFLAGGIFIAVIFIVLKIKLLKQVRAMQDPKNK